MKYKGLLKALAMLVFVAGLGFLFITTVRQAESEPYRVRQEHLRNWVVTVEDPRSTLGALLVLRPPSPLPISVSQQIFRRHAETLLTPAMPGLPLVLRSEFEAVLATVVSVDELAGLAGDAGLAAETLAPRCLAARRRNAGRTLFLLFEAPAFDRFRHQVGGLLEARGGDRAGFDPAALSPLLVVSSSDRQFETWLPRTADPERDCIAPVELE